MITTFNLIFENILLFEKITSSINHVGVYEETED